MLAMFALPLGLSIAYKLFVGGTATIPLELLTGKFGLSGPPVHIWATGYLR